MNKLLAVLHTLKNANADESEQNFKDTEQNSKSVDNDFNYKNICLQNQVEHKEKYAKECDDYKLKSDTRLLSFVSFWSKIYFDKLNKEEQYKGNEFKLPNRSWVGKSVH